MSVALGPWSRSVKTRYASIAAITTMPALSAGGGVIAASSQPSVTHDSAVRATAAMSPESVPFAAQATASSPAARGAARASAIAASGGTATSASQLRPSATSRAAAMAPMTTTIDAGATRAQARPRRRASQGGGARLGKATQAACTTVSANVAAPKGSSIGLDALVQPHAVRLHEVGDRDVVLERALLAGEDVAPHAARPAQHRALPAAHRRHRQDLAAADVGADTGPCLDGLVRAGERIGAARAQRERPPDHEQLARRAVGRRPAPQPLEGLLTRGPVHGAAVVGIDERERDQLVALVDRRHAGRGEQEQHLAERLALALHRHPLGEGQEVVEE